MDKQPARDLKNEIAVLLRKLVAPKEKGLNNLKTHLESEQGGWIFDTDKEDVIAILENAPCGIVINKSMLGKTLYINREAINIAGYTLAEIPTALAALKTFVKLPSTQELRRSAKVFFTSGIVDHIIQITSKDGTVKDVDIKTVLLSDKSIVTMLTDVTRRETAERLIRERESKFRSLFEESPNALLLCDQDIIIDCNPVTQEVLHCKKKELLLKASLTDLMPRRQPDGSLSSKQIRQAIATTRPNKNHKFEWTMKRFDGNIFYAETLMRKTFQAGRELLFIVLRDVTALKEAEKALLRMRDDLEEQVMSRTSELAAANRELRSLSEYLQRAREEERTIIARKVHDELGQCLSVLKMDLVYLGNKLPGEHTSLLTQIKAMEGQIDDALNGVREICSKLRPHVLDRLGLSEGIKWYVKGFQQKTGIICSVRIQHDIPILKKDLALVFFRILQEAMTNVLRHAEATKIGIILRTNGPDMVLKVTDNGKGIRKEDITNPQSFGIIGIQERVRYWGGRSIFKGTPGKGTTVTISIPFSESEHLPQGTFS